MADWVAVETRYRDGELCVDDICARYGVTRRALYRRARKDGWPMRRPPRHSATKTPHCNTGSQAGRPGRSSQQRLISRLFKTLETQMQSIEQRLNGHAAAAPQSAADRERDARTLTALVRTLEKLCELESSADAPLRVAKAAQNNVEKDPARFERDIEDLRTALARRITGFASSGDD